MITLFKNCVKFQISLGIWQKFYLAVGGAGIISIVQTANLFCALYFYREFFRWGSSMGERSVTLI